MISPARNTGLLLFQEREEALFLVRLFLRASHRVAGGCDSSLQGFDVQRLGRDDDRLALGVGRSDLLRVREDLTDREKEIDLSKILNNPFAGPKEKVTFDPKHVYDFELEKTKDETVLLKQLSSALDKKQKRSIDVEVSNTDRSFGTIFGSEITKKYDDTLEEDTFIVKCLSLIHI